MSEPAAFLVEEPHVLTLLAVITCSALQAFQLKRLVTADGTQFRKIVSSTSKFHGLTSFRIVERSPRIGWSRAYLISCVLSH